MTITYEYLSDMMIIVDKIYEFIYLLDDPKRYEVNRRNHLGNKWLICVIGNLVEVSDMPTSIAEGVDI